MIFTTEYFQGEEREGFYVQPVMKYVWAAEQEVLKKIDRICRRHDIKYYGWYGTLLGAVRHHGYIPWDDDIDLAMLRKDYDRFRYYARTELPEGWQLVSEYPTLSRVSNSNCIRLDREFLKRFHGCPYAVGLDIFCLDSIPRDRTEEEIVKNLFSAAFNLYMRWDDYDDDYNDEEQWGLAREKMARELGELVGYSFDRESSMKEQLLYLSDRIPAMYWDDEFDEATLIHKLDKQPDYRIPALCFDRVIEVSFENTSIPILEDYDLICRLTYGDDYMIPAREYSHEYPFFKSQISRLKEFYKKYGQSMPECFNFSPDLLK